MPSATSLSRLLEARANLIADGALATELEARGCNLDDPLWSAKVLVEQPHLIRDVHSDYFAAGAGIATTASYQATPLGFARRGLSAAAALELVALSVSLADEARRGHLAAHPDAGPLLVAGSVGPYGAYLSDGSEYRGDYVLSPAAFEDFHRSRIAALVDAGADVLACETLPSFAEAEALVALVREYGVEAWFTFSLQDGGHLADGTPLEAVAALLDAEPLVAAVGVNCVPLRLVSPALEALGRATATPLMAYPNSGETFDPVAKTWTAGTDAAAAGVPGLAQGAGAWRGLGARILGGCCRTTPADIAALARA
ncbi:homocysteine S-methyltransferase [Pseudarthrobacter sp. MEB009]|uniref:homocysteine S-methyltransferase n=1 Tax=Pseudarthrobacter sp. MEB009 TaxID=3040326 RepID=UPI0025563BCA|nr:homocysteine S-methyltransferase [Pseudarthrobacter sp. MEB009]